MTDGRKPDAPAADEYLGVPPDQPDADDQLDRRCVEIAFETLGEHIVVALREDAVDVAQRTHPDLVVYGPEEVEHLQSQNATDEMLRAVHVAKKELSGKVIDPDLLDLEPRTSRSVHTILTAAGLP